MKHFMILVLVSVSLFMLGQTLFSQKPAVSGEEAISLSYDMRRSDQALYLAEQARRFYQQGRFGDCFNVAAYAREKLGIDSPVLAEFLIKSRQELEETALIEAEKVQQRVRELVNLP